MSTSIQPREGVFPGYTLTDRLGSGGYAEVWRARAPGGIEKAVKIVFGCCDDQLASQEMKAMERIKDVRHPFVLSLERFEIVDGRLAILTELADMSLEQYAQACRAKGLPGIPRDKLLGFMADTADALDFLAERHNLQHLDIKPANLLISGDHIKVADFGLVKELASRTQNSMVAGLTPTYSSPEMFDDAPSSQSDQYSLAIVYQEMLTGILPFPGRTAAQLANQHLRSQPQLTALPECDQAVVARALAKDPTERFASCRAFVKALTEVNGAAGNQSSVVSRAKGGAESRPQDRSCMPSTTMPRTVERIAPPRSPLSVSKAPQQTEAKSHSSIDTTAIEKPAPAPVAQPKEDIVDVNLPEISAETMQSPPPTLYIGIGGVGIRILSRLRDLLARQVDAGQQSTAIEMLAIDTDREELRNAASLNWRSPLTATDTVHVPLKMPQVYREEGRSNLEWLSHRWLYNIPRSLETRGYRPLGRLALVDHVDKVVSLVDQKLRRLEASQAGDANLKKSQEIQIVLLTSMGGGTGSGMAIDLANAVRSRVQASGHPALVRGVFVCTCLENANAPPLSAANTYALLTELQFASKFGNQSAQTESQNLKQLESADRPFEQIYCVKQRQHGKESTDDELAVIARQLSLASTDGVFQTLQRCREALSSNQPDAQQPFFWRTFGSASVEGPMQTRVNRLAKYLERELVQQWFEEVPAEVWERFNQTADDEALPENEGLEDETAAPNEAAAAKSDQVEKLRRAFGGNSSTRFAYEVVTRVVEQAAPESEDGPVMLSPRHLEHFTQITAQALLSIKEIIAEPQNSDELSAENEIIVCGLAADGGRALARYLEEIDRMSADPSFETSMMLEILPTLCTKVVEEYYAGTVTSESSSMRMADAQTSLKNADVDLLQCGYQRHTLIAVPSGRESSEAIDALKEARPTAATVPAKVGEAFVLCEGSGIKPSSLARGFERVYPGIASAASRLFTRVDVNWSDPTL